MERLRVLLTTNLEPEGIRHSHNAKPLYIFLFLVEGVQHGSNLIYEQS